MKLQCPDCGRAFSLKAEYAGRRGKCGCGKRIPFPQALWPTRETAEFIREDLRGFNKWPAARLEQMRDFLVFQLEMLPKVAQRVLDEHYRATPWVDPVTLASSALTVDSIIEHICQRAGTRPTTVYCVRGDEQSFVDGSNGWIHSVRVQVVPKGAPEPRYFAYRLDTEEYFVDRPRW